MTSIYADPDRVFNMVSHLEQFLQSLGISPVVVNVCFEGGVRIELPMPVDEVIKYYNHVPQAVDDIPVHVVPRAGTFRWKRPDQQMGVSTYTQPPHETTGRLVVRRSKEDEASGPLAILPVDAPTKGKVNKVPPAPPFVS